MLVGGSSGTAAVAAVKLAKTLAAEAIVVVILPDSGRGYMSKIFNDDWMIANGFLADAKRRATVGDVLRSKTPLPPLITVQHDDTVKTALDLLRKYEISQIPVMRGHEQVGSVNDVGVMQSVFDHADILHQPVSEVMGRPFPALEQFEEIERAYKLLTLANPGDRRDRRRRADRRAHAPRHHQLPLDQLRRRSQVTSEVRDKAIHVGQEADPTTGATIVPIYQTSTYTQTAVGEHKGFDYSRTINPTRLALERQLASLEGARYGSAFASGMAATSAVLNLLSAGDHVVVSDDLYGGTYRLFTRVLQRYGLEFTYVDMSDLGAVRAAMRPARNCSGSKRRPIRCSSSSTSRRSRRCAGPARSSPSTIPSRRRISSSRSRSARRSSSTRRRNTSAATATSSAASPSPTNPSRSTNRFKFTQNAVGGVPGPHDAWLTMRGAKTLALRMREHARNAAA